MATVDHDVHDTGIAALFELHGKEISPVLLGLYWEALRDLTPAQFREATGRALRECKFLPKPAELRELAGNGSAARALIAWDAVRAALRKYSYTTSVDFGPLVNAVIRSMGGWYALDDMATSELDVWGKKEFERVYALLAVKDPAALNGALHRGAFGGVPVRIAIDGVMPPLQIGTENQHATHEHVMALVESKSLHVKRTAKGT